jgi:hypothetical protein
MEWLADFWAWAWARHHNILSWYIRPLFLIPFIAFAYRRSLQGIVLTLLALATSMFWFPAPAQPDPGVIAFLEAEQEYLFGPWNIWKGLLSSLVPVSLLALALAFWRRSFVWGLVVLNAIALVKTLWSFAVSGAGGGLAVTLPALAGLVITDILIIAVWRFLHMRQPPPTSRQQA